MNGENKTLGECLYCAGNKVCILTGFSLYRIAKRLNISLDSIVELKEFCIKLNEPNTALPLYITRIKADGVCYFLENGVCSLQEDKPLECVFNQKGYLSKVSGVIPWDYIDCCEDEDKKTRLRQSIKDTLGYDLMKAWENSGLKGFSAEQTAWLLLFAVGNRCLTELEACSCDEEYKARIKDAVEDKVYWSYDIDKPYSPQALENLQVVEDVRVKIKNLY